MIPDLSIEYILYSVLAIASSSIAIAAISGAINTSGLAKLGKPFSCLYCLTFWMGWILGIMTVDIFSQMYGPAKYITMFVYSLVIGRLGFTIISRGWL